VRKKRLREEYSVFWAILALLVFTLSIWKGSLIQISNLLHFPSPILTVIFFGLFLLLCICLYFSCKLSELQRKLNIFAQEMTLREEETSRWIAMTKDRLGYPNKEENK
jgi:hypothetical protein